MTFLCHLLYLLQLPSFSGWSPGLPLEQLQSSHPKCSHLKKVLRMIERERSPGHLYILVKSIWSSQSPYDHRCYLRNVGPHLGHHWLHQEVHQRLLEGLNPEHLVLYRIMANNVVPICVHNMSSMVFLNNWSCNICTHGMLIIDHWPYLHPTLRVQKQNLLTARPVHFWYVSASFVPSLWNLFFCDMYMYTDH